MSDAQGLPLAEFGARPSAFTIFGILCGVMTAVGILATKESPSNWPMAFAPVAAYLCAFAWLSQLKLAFYEDRFTYQSLFVKQRAVRYASIKSVARVRGSSLFASRNTVLVTTMGGEPLRVNMRLFPDEAIERLMQLKKT